MKIALLLLGASLIAAAAAQPHVTPNVTPTVTVDLAHQRILGYYTACMRTVVEGTYYRDGVVNLSNYPTVHKICLSESVEAMPDEYKTIKPDQKQQDAILNDIAAEFKRTLAWAQSLPRVAPKFIPIDPNAPQI